jgi:hypothetical protein
VARLTRSEKKCLDRIAADAILPATRKSIVKFRRWQEARGRHSVRTFWTTIAVVAVVGALAATVEAQNGVSLTTYNGGNAAKATTISPFNKVSVAQMLPKVNTAQALGVSPLNQSRIFPFAKMLPNFSFLNNRWPLNATNPAYTNQVLKTFNASQPAGGR